MTISARLLRITNRLMAAQLILIVAGTVAVFGGAVWWMKPTVGVLSVSLAATALIRESLMRRLVVLRSPLTAIGVLVVTLAAIQVVPLPGRLASLLSPNARSVHALGVLPSVAKVDDPSIQMPEILADRTPATIDRPATLRWILGAVACLSLFCVCSRYADRLSHSSVIWGSIVGVFFLATTFAGAQLLGGASGIYGTIEPGSGRPLAPSAADLAAASGSPRIQPLVETDGITSQWVIDRPGKPYLLATMLGGVGSYLALAALGLPLAFGLTLHVLSPRGSREPLRARLRGSHRSGLAFFLVLMTFAATLVVGFLAGPVLTVAYGLALMLVGFMPAWSSGLRWLAVGLTLAMLGGVAGGTALGESIGRPSGTNAIANAVTWPTVRQSLAEASRAFRDFPMIGSGFGTYSTIVPYVRAIEPEPAIARSSVVAWIIESGLVGTALVSIAGLWCLTKLPGAFRRVGSADKTLAYMLLGTVGCFAIVSATLSTIEILALGLAACAVAGTANRWLAGGTDLFVEPA